MAARRLEARSTASPPIVRACSSTSAPPRRLERATIAARSASPISARSPASASIATRSCAIRQSRIRSRAGPSTSISSSSWRKRSASPRPMTALVQPDRVERADEQLDHLDRARRAPRRRSARPRPGETRAAARSSADRAEGAALVAQPERALAVGEAVGDQPRDRHGHVAAQRQRRAGLVEEAVARSRRGRPARAPRGTRSSASRPRRSRASRTGRRAWPRSRAARPSPRGSTSRVPVGIGWLISVVLAPGVRRRAGGA